MKNNTSKNPIIWIQSYWVGKELKLKKNKNCTCVAALTKFYYWYTHPQVHQTKKICHYHNFNWPLNIMFQKYCHFKQHIKCTPYFKIFPHALRTQWTFLTINWLVVAYTGILFTKLFKFSIWSYFSSFLFPPLFGVYHGYVFTGSLTQ